MPAAPITALYAAALGVLIVILSFRVVRARRTHKVGLGSHGNKEVEHAMRVQANCVEYVPIALLLILLLELNQAPGWSVHALGAVLVIARILHAFGFASSIRTSFGRVAGTAMTWAIIILAAAGNLLVTL